MRRSGNLLLLTDYRGAFQSSYASRKGDLTLDVGLLVSHFEKLGIEVDVCSFGALDFTKDFHGRHVILTSSEDSGLRYKSFIEDVALTLESLGAVVLPRYALLRAHHNKVMMEGLRYALFPEEAAALSTKLFGALEDVKVDWDDEGDFPKVVKAAEGAGSVSVALAKNRSELFRTISQMSRSALSGNEILREIGKRWLRKDWKSRSLHREKFIVQNMITGLSGDFKVLVFGSRYYVLSRRNRPGDFRASGSGLFSFDIPPEVELNGLLDFAEQRFARIASPTLSLDIAFDGRQFWMVEFQALHFGTLTAENSPNYFIKKDGVWEPVMETCVIEAVYAEAVAAHVARDALRNLE